MLSYQTASLNTLKRVYFNILKLFLIEVDFKWCHNKNIKLYI